ncbi:MAG: carboxypeptidase regulatory-like domain-containing protein [Terracidiphilus sp.]
MRRRTIGWEVAGFFVTGTLAALGQPPAAPAPLPPASEVMNGGRLHGVVKSGAVPLAGVTITAQNTLTGKRFSTTTGITGAWSLNIPQNGRYVVRAQFAGFAPAAEEAVLNAASRDQSVSLELVLASRAAAQQESESAEQSVSPSAIRQLMANGAQNLSLMSALTGDTESQAGASGAAGAALPSIAGNSDFGGDSVAISGQTGAVSPLAGLDMDRVRDVIETLRAQGVVIPDGMTGGGNFGGFGGGGFGGPGGFGGGGRGNFRGFNPGQPHGAIFWIVSNSALNAEPFSLRAQSQPQPPSGSNRFGITFMSAPYLPGLTKPSGKDTVFLTLSGTRSSSLLNEYATVPTDGSFGTYNQRTGDFTGQPLIYDPSNDTTCVNFNVPGQPSPTPGQPFPGNMIPKGCIVSPANTLLLGNANATPALTQFFPAPSLPGDTQNYHLLTTAQSNATQAGVRYMRSLGANATQPGGSRGGFGSGGGGGRRAQQNQGLRQSINFNYNWSGTAKDNVNIFPQLGGKSSTNSNSVQAGYTVGYHKETNIFNANWNRATSQTTNFFTNGSDVAGSLGIAGTDSSPLNYGLPNVVLSSLTGLNEQQPSFSLSQTISLTETLSWIYAKHNLRFGGDYRRVHRDFLGSSNATGTFTFSGLFTEDTAHDATTGSSLADFLLGLPQETTIDASAGKSYLRDNVWDAFATDDWRVRTNLTLTYGLRYEFFAPYTEKYNRLAFVDSNPVTNENFPAPFGVTDEVQAGGAGSYNGKLPDSLVYPYRTAFAPRVGVALRLPRQTVLRAGYGINYTVGQYATFATTMARQPMVNQPAFVNEQTNEAAAAGELLLANGFSAPDTVGNYAVDPHYHLPYVQAWNLDVQKTLPWSVVLNAGYNGSRGNHLDVTTAPRPTASSPSTDLSGLIFNYEQSAAFSKFNAGALRVNKRLSSGIALGANYQYSHSIDDAGSVGRSPTVVAQNWQDLGAEEGNSSFDVRHNVSGTYLYELPFGKDKFWITSGVGSHILEGFSISGSFTFATGTPLTPSYQAAVEDVANGTAGTQRPNRVPGVSITAGAGSLLKWFNPAAFTQPSNDSTTPNCPNCGNVSRNSIAGPGKILNNIALSKTMQLGGTRSMEMRAMANNVFNTVQYSGVDTNAASPTFGQVTSAASMRAFQFTARFRF